ncbi:MAG: thiamine diphosphokinase [Lachnospiraceae bacterium]|nr:thiamine diphosphokinase [Lachnospiraceae bacterium]
MKRCIIIAGADIGNYDRLKKYIKTDDYIICCDSGLKHCTGLGVKPDLIVGDFDSYIACDEIDRAKQSDDLSEKTTKAMNALKKDCLLKYNTELQVLPCEKDDTDTVYGVKEAVKRGFREFLLFGIIGNRLDHTLGNVYILFDLDAKGVSAMAVDDYSEMRVVSKRPVTIPAGKYAYFSLLNLTGKAKGVTIKHAKYCLEDAEITSEYQYGISNETMPGKDAIVSVKDGKLLLIGVFA